MLSKCLLNDCPVHLSDITSSVQGASVCTSRWEAQRSEGLSRVPMHPIAKRRQFPHHPKKRGPSLGLLTKCLHHRGAETRCQAGAGARLLSGNTRCWGGSAKLTYRVVSSVLPPGGALARQARGRWQCSAFRGETVAAAPAAWAGKGNLLS